MSDNQASTSETKAVTFKKRSRLAVQRRRGGSDSSSNEESGVIERKRKQKANPMIQTTNAKQRRSTRQADSSSSEDAANADWSVDKRSNIAVMYESKKDTNESKDQNATATNEIETEHGQDAQARFERNQKIIAETRGKADDKIYRGMGTYGNFMEKKDTAAGNAASGFVRKGPIRAPAVVRASVVWDYKPDLCKDYKETGFCGFGDSCKFMHDRTDYKHGWELEREVNEGRHGASDADPHKYEISSEDDEELPFKCFICRESFTDPVVTKCTHYFCEKCAIEYFQKTPKCYVCDKPTGGVFNPAKEIIARLHEPEFGGGGTKSKRKRKGYRKEALETSSESDKDDEPIENQGDIDETPMEKLPDPEPLKESIGSEESSDGD